MVQIIDSSTVAHILSSNDGSIQVLSHIIYLFVCYKLCPQCFKYQYFLKLTLSRISIKIKGEI